MRRFHPNFLLLDFVPVEGLEVTAEYWVPESHVMAGPTDPNQPHDLSAARGCGAVRHPQPTGGQGLWAGAAATDGARAGRSDRRAAAGGLHAAEGPKQGTGPHPALRLGLDFEGGTRRSVHVGLRGRAIRHRFFRTGAPHRGAQLGCRAGAHRAGQRGRHAWRSTPAMQTGTPPWPSPRRKRWAPSSRAEQHLPKRILRAHPRPGLRIQPHGRWVGLLDVMERAVTAGYLLRQRPAPGRTGAARRTCWRTT